MSDICNDNRFEMIEKYCELLKESTNIETSYEEMQVIDNILFRFWQMGWLDKIEFADNVVRCSDCKHFVEETIYTTENGTRFGHCNYRGCCLSKWGNDYCSRAERKEAKE